MNQMLARVTSWPFLLLVAIICSSGALAAWKDVDLEVLVRESTSIAFGPMVAVMETKDTGFRKGLSLILPREWILHPGRQSDILPLLWNSGNTSIEPRLPFGSLQGRSGIWLLVDQADGTLRANHPGRFIKSSQADRVRALIAKNPIRLILSKSDTENSPPVLRVVLTNTSSEPIIVPWIQIRSNGFVEWPNEYSLTVLHSTQSEGDESDDPHWYWNLMGVDDIPIESAHKMRRIDIKKDRLLILSPTTLVRIQPHEFSKRDLPLSDLYDLPKMGHFVIYLSTASGWRSNTVSVSARDIFDN